MTKSVVSFLGVGLGICVMWLSMRLAWAYYLVLVIPLVVYLVRSTPRNSGFRPAVVRGGALTALVFLAVLSPLGALVSGGVRAHPLLASAAALVIYGSALVQLLLLPRATPE